MKTRWLIPGLLLFVASAPAWAGAVTAPELNTHAAGGAVAVAVGVLLLISDRRKR